MASLKPTGIAAKEAQREVLALRSRIQKLDQDSQNLLFSQARSHHTWQDKAVSDDTIRELYELMKWGGTANNGNPARLFFIRSAEAKARLSTALAPGNVVKMEKAPLTVLIAYDTQFYEHFETLFPIRPEAADAFRENPKKAEEAAFRNSSLQGAYLMTAARAIGLDIGPMSGFNNGLVDELFLEGTSLKSNFLCNLGYADTDGLFERLPRFSFEDVCKII